MNLQPLFETQKILDDRIVKEKGLEGQDLLPEKILALRVELGELANEWRGFKFWSKYQKPKIKIKTTEGANAENAVEFICDYELCGERFDKSDSRLQDLFGDNNEDCPVCEDGILYAYRTSYPLLEEYVDCLHFLLSIGLEFGYTFTPSLKWRAKNITSQFNDLFSTVATFYSSIEADWGEEEKQENFENLTGCFICLGEMLGFTWGQIEEAYYSKNQINHTRQATGY